MNAAIERLQDAVVDGRAETIRFRQNQLQSLHLELRNNEVAIRAAMAKDTAASTAEVETEFFLAMEAVRHFYEGINFEKSLEDEYLVKEGKDNLQRRVGYGLVVLRPTSHTRLFSVLSPLAAALAAGCCVILELQGSLLNLDEVLRQTLPKALDCNIFSITNKVTDPSILSTSILVDQTSNAGSKSLNTELLSSNGHRTVSVVDRTADIDAAARAITTARFSFGGMSPYAPDLVLVNEFVKKDFFEACSKYATLSFARETTMRRVGEDQSSETRKAIKEAEEKRLVTSFGSNDFKLVDIQNRDAAIMNIKIRGRYLPISTYSSLVDAIYNHSFDEPLLAAYLFASNDAAKYLSQHLPAHISCINQIPIPLLVGPATPIAHSPDICYRYNTNMFSISRPQVIQALPGSVDKAEKLIGGEKGVTAQSLRALAVKPLKPTGQPGNEFVGFFETGIFMGAGIVLTIVLPVVGFGTYFMGRRGLEYVTRLRA
ncbi:Fc.00g053180.m01.CDS01 [Cosmosporella sp. VM-42]